MFHTPEADAALVVGRPEQRARRGAGAQFGARHRPVVAKVGRFEQWPLILIDLHTKEGVTGRAYLAPYDRRDGDPAALVSDATRAREILGWRRSEVFLQPENVSILRQCCPVTIKTQVPSIDKGDHNSGISSLGTA